MYKYNLDNRITEVLHNVIDNLLKEYYVRVSSPKNDSKILNGSNVWIYTNDRNDYTPHCHLISNDGSTEFEVSLIDFNIIHIKRGKNKNINELYECFLEWLTCVSNKSGDINKNNLFNLLDYYNVNNQLNKFINSHKIIVKDADLIKYIENIDKQHVKETRRVYSK